MNAPPHVLRMLEALGRADTGGVSRRARMATCRGCHQWIVAGLDDEPCGLPTSADPTHLDPVQELQFLLTGKHTFDLIYGPTLQYRDQFRIGPTRPFPVLPEHDCEIARVPDRIVIDAFWPVGKEYADDPPF